MLKILISVICVYLLLISTTWAQKKSSIRAAAVTQESIFQLKKESDAAFAVNIQSMLLDTCNNGSTGKRFIMTGRILKKYYDKTGKFKEQKLLFLSDDTTVYAGSPHAIVFVKHSNTITNNNCPHIQWIARPSGGLVFSQKTEQYIAKKQEE